MTLERRLRSSVLIVDDVPANINLLGDALMSEYDVRAVTSGPEALEIVFSDQPPDLILLDIMMPEMDGYEICRRIKMRKDRATIPIIFITARTEAEDETRGFDFGAVDYITKPFRLSVVKARVRTHIELKNHRDQLERIVRERTEEIRKAYDQVRQEIEERKTAQQHLQATNQALQESLIQLRHTQDHLIQSEKMAALGGLVAGVAHEISTPVGIGFTAASFLSMKTKKYFENHRLKPLSSEEMEKFMQLANEAAEIIHTNLNRAGELITSFKQVGADQSNEECRSFNFKQYLQTILFSLQPKLKQGRHKIRVSCPDSVVIMSYPGVFSQIITNLVINSVTHGFDGIAGGLIDLLVTTENGFLQIHYQDNGKGMNEEQLHKIYDPFFTTKRSDGGTGLGMHITYNLVTQVLKGRIQCNVPPAGGLSCVITIPLSCQGSMGK